MTDFFASRHSDVYIHCEDYKSHEAPLPCQDAHSDAVNWSSASSFVSNSILSFALVRLCVSLLMPAQPCAHSCTLQLHCAAPCTTYLHKARPGCLGCNQGDTYACIIHTCPCIQSFPYIQITFIHVADGSWLQHVIDCNCSTAFEVKHLLAFTGP